MALTHYITNKTTYGGMLVDKYFVILDNGEDVQVSSAEWDNYEIGDEWTSQTNKIRKNDMACIREFVCKVCNKNRFEVLVGGVPYTCQSC